MEDINHTLITVKEDEQDHSSFIYSWIDKIKNKSFNHTNYWIIKWIVLCYVGFSFVLTCFHAGLWLIPSREMKLTRTYDPDATYSALNSMSFELKMSKMLSKTNTKSISGIVPYWKQSQTPITDSQDITLITVVYNETWSQFIDLVESWKGPVSAVLCTHPNQTLTTISSDYHQIPTLHRHVTLHLAPSTLPENASRNLARLYASTHHILDATTNIVFSLDLRIRLLENLMQYADMMARGDMLVVPTFKKADGAKVVETRQGVLDLIENGTVGLYDAHFELNQGPTDVRQWRDSEDLYYYPVERYAMQYEPIVIQSKTVQPWCSERFLNKRSVCLLSDYLAGNDFKVLTFGWAMYQHDNANPVSDLDNVLEKKIHIYFLIEQCIHHSRQLDALGLWRTSQAIHIKTLCPGVLAKWGKKLIKHY